MGTLFTTIHAPSEHHQQHTTAIKNLTSIDLILLKSCTNVMAILSDLRVSPGRITMEAKIILLVVANAQLAGQTCTFADPLLAMTIKSAFDARNLGLFIDDPSPHLSGFNNTELNIPEASEDVCLCYFGDFGLY